MSENKTARNDDFKAGEEIDPIFAAKLAENRASLPN
jgi:hypothetical protein